MLERHWRILASIFIAIILVSSSLAPFQNFSPKSHDQNNQNQNAFATSGNDISNIGNYVIFGFNSVTIEKEATINNGNIGVQNTTAEVDLQKSTIIKPSSISAVVGDVVTIEKSTTVNDVYFNHLSNQGTITGNQNTPLTLPVVKALPTFPTITTGTNSVDVSKSSSLVLQAGNYGDVTIEDYATLELSGVYNFKSLTMDKSSKLIFDKNSQVQIVTDISGNKNLMIGPSSSSSGLDATGIVLFVGGDVNTGDSSVITANIYAPNGEISMAKNTQAIGSFIANTISIQKDSVFTLSSAFAIPAITWTPTTYSIQAKPFVPLTLNFTSSAQISTTSVIVSSQLSGIVIAPSTIPNVAPNVIQQLPITLAIPPGTTSGWHNGTITLAKNSTPLSNSFALNILVPTVTTTTESVSTGTYEYVQTPSNSPFFTNTSDVSVYFAFNNGTQIPLQTYYDVFPSNSPLPVSFDTSSKSNSVPISLNPIDILTKILFPSKSLPLSIPEISAIIGTTLSKNQCTNYSMTYHFENYSPSQITNDISVANNALSVNPNNPLIIRDDIRWRLVDNGTFVNGAWTPKYNDTTIDSYFQNLPSGANVFVILSVQDPPNAIALQDQISVPNGKPTTFAEFEYKNAANAFITHTMNHIISTSAFNKRVVYWQIDNEPNMHPVMTLVKQFPIGNIFFADWKTTVDALQLWLGTANTLDPSRPTVLNVYEADLPPNFLFEPYRSLLASDHTIGQEMINNLGIMSFDIYPDQWAVGESVVTGFHNTMAIVKDQFTYAQGTFGFTGRWGIDEMAAGPKPAVIGNIFFTQPINPSDVSSMITESRTSQFGGQFPAFVSLFQLRALDHGPIANQPPFDDAYGLVNGTSGLTNDGNNNTPNFLGSIENSVVQDCPSSGSPTSIPRNGLVGEWNLENNVLDTSGNNNNGVGGGTNFISGKIGQALSFDGVSNVVSVANNPSINFGTTGSFSISLWMKSTQSGGGDAGFGLIVDKRPNNDGQYKGYSIEDNSGQLIGRIRDGSSHDVPVISTTNVNDGNFHHIVYVVDRSAQTSNLYIDNILQATTSISSVGSIDSSVNLLFGGQASPNTQIDFYSGILDQIRMYNRALSTADIQSLFNEGGSSGLPGTVAGTIQVGSSPTGIGVNTQTNKIYVANEFSNTVSVIDATTNTVIKTIPVGTRPLDVDVNMQTNKIYVANYNSNTVSVIDGTTDTVVSTITVGINPTDAAVNPTTNKIYASNYNSGTISVIDGTTNNVVKTIPVGLGAADVGVNQITNTMYAVNAQPGTVSVIDGTTDTVVSTITVGSNPQLAAVNPTTNKVFITNNLSNTVSVIDGGSNTVVSTIPVAAGPGGIGINTVTNKIYYPTNSGTVQVIDGNSNAIITTISVGGSPDYIGVNAITNKIYVADISSTIVTIINGL